MAVGMLWGIVLLLIILWWIWWAASPESEASLRRLHPDGYKDLQARRRKMIADPTTILTEDGVRLKEGDRAYDYYSMKPGVIGKLTDNFRDGVWFDFHHDDGTTNLLNGQRICSTEFAKGRGFRDA